MPRYPLVWSARQPSRERAGIGTADFEREITNDPLYKIAQTNFDRATQSGRGSLRDQIQQLVFSSGFNPTQDMTAAELEAYGGDVDQATLAAAAKNPFSIKSQLEATRNAGAQNLRYSLAARGLGASGAVPAGQSVLNMNYQRGGYEQMQKLLGALRGNIGDYTTLQNQQQATLDQARFNVGTRLAQTPGAAPRPPRYDPATTAAVARGKGFGKVPKSALAHWGG